ncbi:MAG: CpaD family pilus assembly lipoprotein [Alphaproteobacteria bacterium]|nr:CpaD family pilus assembly lipoprotein [Alphaproteobacteria bacterium]
MTQSRLPLFAFSLLALSACADPYTPTPRPDYAIGVVPTRQGSIAVPPACPSWATATTDPYDNQPLPQFGCASARNLASMVENPDDLLKGRPLANERGVHAVGDVRRYDNNQTRGLVMPAAEDSQIAVTTAPASSSALSGDITGAASSSSSTATAAAAP